jgi:site-specific DNA-methyltransferase (adenine-specific)/modification methylase
MGNTFADFYHLTQKPLALFKWCLYHHAKAGERVGDPFMGSGTTGVACVQLGMDFWGADRIEKYYQVALQRITEARAQPGLF